MNIKRRLEKLEATLGGVANLHWIGVIFAHDDETAVECITRVATEQGLALSDVGHAVVCWRNDHPPHRYETFRHPDVHDITTLIGYVSQDQRVKERERREKAANQGEI